MRRLATSLARSTAARPGVFVAPPAIASLGGVATGLRYQSTKIKIGDQVPNAKLHKGFPPQMVPLADYCKGKKVVLVGLPGAFTPT